MYKKLISVLLISSLLSACSMQQGRYADANDSKPDRLPTSLEMKDAIPRDSAPSRGGNRNYDVRGKHYKVLKSAKNFKQTGIASWYGKKFHGHLTSNGEIYDMYSMSAAHKNLPLPTYVRVTNLANNKSVIVRVNDRGPFHQNRIIDLSYSAAYKLDMLKTGTAKVQISVITASMLEDEKLRKSQIKQKNKELATKPLAKPITNPVIKPITNGYVIQVFATKNQQLAKSTANTLSKKYKQQVNIPLYKGVYRVQIGPFSDNRTLSAILRQLKKTDYPNAFRKKQ